MKWNDGPLEHHQANGSDAEGLCIFRWERDGSVSELWVRSPASWKVWTLLVKARDVTYAAGPPAGGRSDWAVRAEMLLPSMRLSDIRISLGEPGRPQGLQPVDMLVMSSSVAGSSYRSVVTFSGQGRLNDILTWNKAKGRVNAKYKQHSVKVCYSGPAWADVQMSGIRRLQPSHKHSWMIPGKIAAESANGWKNNTLTMIPIMCRRQWDGISTFSCLKSTLRVNISGILTFLLGSTCSQWNWSSSPSRSPTWTWEQMSFCWPKTWRLCRLRSCSATLPECRRTLDKTPLLTPFTGHLRWY